MSPDQRSAWKFVHTLNRVWTEGRPEELKDFFHSEIVAIVPTSRERLVGRDACIEGWTSFVKAATIYSWTETNPMVSVFGDTAIVTYEYQSDVLLGANRMSLTGRDMFTLIRHAESWLAVADQFSAFPE